ncbi:MAG TPA: PTS sugar transporter subunit IIB [Candidatus Anaerostipes excrementavium]|uniref:PTS sugar transporter subunit IIB n=1 Tax=Candidatus Anaerostipes excrementavium TaxID=2838463 RepID=A0A9D1WWM5_9FIRM|nr:PTS sugar transporter subunit IIB [uncultured Anaerostipes sp.]HIX68508.1 PTS sugar transporter subunit IIB [Candidatus Anaerostipes excrementavium]
MAKRLAVRVDDRLIHGQVVTQWVKVFKAQKIVVIDDTVAKDKMQKNILKFAAPSDIKVSILSVEKAAEVWEKNKFGNLSVFVLFKDVKQIAKLKEKGVSFDEITLGNMSIVNGRKQIYKSTGFTEEEAQVLFDLQKDGMHIFFQTQPTDKKESLDAIWKVFPNVH